jgi:hypothetical protein
MAKVKQQNQAGNVMTDIAIRELLNDYLDICNRAIEENAGNFWYEKAIQLNDAIWENPNFRVMVYDQDPDSIMDEYIVHFNTDITRLSLSETDQEVEFSCKFPLSYLEDVVKTRPDWYIQNPLMLDWKWFTDRVETGSKNFFQKNKYLTVGLGLITGAALATFFARRSSKKE